MDHLIPSVTVGQEGTQQWVSKSSSIPDLDFFGRNAGPGPRVPGDVRLQAIGGDPNRQSISFGPFLDLVPFSYPTRLVGFHTLSLAQSLDIIQPYIVRSNGSFVSALSLDNGLATVAKEPAYRFNGQPITSYTDIEDAINQEFETRSWTSYGVNDRISAVGSLYIVPILNSYSLLIPLPDGGALAYDPFLAPSYWS